MPNTARLFAEGVDPGPADEGADAAWSAEAKRRLEDVRTGAVKPVPWDEAERLIFDPSDDPKDR